MKRDWKDVHQEGRAAKKKKKKKGEKKAPTSKKKSSEGKLRKRGNATIGGGKRGSGKEVAKRGSTGNEVAESKKKTEVGSIRNGETTSKKG